MSTRPQSVIRLVRADDTQPDGKGGIGWSDGRGMVRMEPDSVARRGLAEIASSPAEPDRAASTIWWEIFAFFMEGFALYGAAVHPTAAMPIHAMPVAKKDLRPHEDDCESPEPARSGLGEGVGNVVALDHVRRPAAQPEPRWTWLSSLGETLTVLSRHRRAEREIKQAVAALMKRDDRTLRDLGILDRSDIERMACQSVPSVEASRAQSPARSPALSARLPATGVPITARGSSSPIQWAAV